MTEHPATIITGLITTILFLCFYAWKKRRSIFIRGRGTLFGFWGGRGRGRVTQDKGEYAAISVYDELLDDFGGDDLSSYIRESDDDDDDDSIGTIISQWSNGRKPGSSGHGSGVSIGRNGRPGKIELTAFDDGHLTLSEVNG